MEEVLDAIDALVASADNTGCSADLTVVSAAAVAKLEQLCRGYRVITPGITQSE
jgi:orotidine-5'-phosphate decarboxylase